MLGELVDGRPEDKARALALDVLLHFSARSCVKYRGEDPVRQINDGYLRLIFVECLGSLESDKARADYQHLNALFDLVFDRLYAVVGHECVVFHLVQPVHRRDERLGACRDHQLVIAYGASVVEHDCLSRRVYLCDLVTQNGLNAVLFIEIGLAVIYILVGNLAHEPVGNERAGVGVIILVGDNGDLPRLVDLADTGDRSDSRCGVSYNNIVHIPSPHLSSYTIALFGQPFTQAGSPFPLERQRSHLRIL